NLSIDGSILSDTLIPRPGGYTFKQRFGLQDSLNFYFGVSDFKILIPPGQFTFTLAVDPSAPASNAPLLDGSITHDQALSHHEYAFFEDGEKYNFVTTKRLRILAIADPRLSSADAQKLFNAHHLSLDFLEAAYPVDHSQVQMQTLRLGKDFVDIDYL